MARAVVPQTPRLPAAVVVRRGRPEGTRSARAVGLEGGKEGGIDRVTNEIVLSR